MRVRYFHSFDKSLNNLSQQEQSKAIQAIKKLLDYFSSGPKPIGLGLRKLRGSYWEIRASLDKRVLFLLKNDVLSFVIVGNHDDIRRYIRGI